MPSFLKISFLDKYELDLKRLDPMQPMDLGDGPEQLELIVTIPKEAPETSWNPLFGAYWFYTGYLFNGSTSRSVFVKWARSRQKMKELKKEGDFYCSALRKLQGGVVPNFYGYYTTIGSKLCGLGCMILEKMDGGWVIDDGPKLEAAYRLHSVGIRHGGFDNAENFILHGDKVYIIDFSEAKARCGCEMTRDRVRLCTELKKMEEKLGDGGTNSVLKEIGVPLGWRVCLKEGH